jgi:hypothetical protein
MLGAANSSGTVTYVNGVNSAAPDTSTTNTYVWWDSALQATTVYKPDTGSSTTYTTTYTYNAFAQLTSIGVADGRPRTVTLRNSADGQAIRRDEADALSGGDPHEVYYRLVNPGTAYLFHSRPLPATIAQKPLSYTPSA